MVLVYITRLIPYLNPNIKSFTIETLAYLAEMRLEWLDISWGYTETCGCRKFFNPIYSLLNSSVSVLITNSLKQLVTFMTISHGKGDMYFSILFFTCLTVLRLADSNLAGMDKFYYYSRMTKHCIEKTIYDIDYQ